MLTIRLTRKGKKNQPFFRVVVIDKRKSATGGRPAEILGFVDPLTKKKSLKKDRILHWIKMGAQPSPTIHNLLVQEKIIDAKKINVSKKSKKVVAAAAFAPAGASASVEAPADKLASQEVVAPAPVADTTPKVETPAPVVEKIEEKAPEKPAEPEKVA